MKNKKPKKKIINVKPGILYVVATPLGNRDDITVRALNVLRDVNLIAAEDTRKTRRVLARHGISNRLISYHEHNEAERTVTLIAKLQKGASIALVSNAGTPAVSDPGYRLIEGALKNHLKIVPVPGVCAATAALSVAGLPTDSFVFLGFLARKKARRIRQLSALTSQPRTLIFYESPRRILKLLKETIDIMGNRRGVLAREMTKLHEEFIRGRLSEIADRLKVRPDIKGECTLLVAGRGKDSQQTWPDVEQQIAAAVMAGQNSLSTIAREIAANSAFTKNKIYAEALKISKTLGGE